MADLYGLDFGFRESPNLTRVTTSLILPASSKEDLLREANGFSRQQMQRIYKVERVIVNWWDDSVEVVEKGSSNVLKKAADPFFSQTSGGSTKEQIEKFLAAGEVSQRLMGLSDRQVGQLVWDYLGDEFSYGSVQSLLWRESAERLRRSSAGSRTSEECFNTPDTLVCCSRCHSPMLRVIGIGEPDYFRCVSLACGHKQHAIQ